MVEGYTIFDMARLAMLIDCEGTICITGSSNRGNSPIITIDNTCFGIIGWAKQFFDGTMVKCAERRNPKHKKCFRVRWSGKVRLLALLGAIEPYLIVKKSRAQEAIRYCALIRPRGGNRPMPDTIKQEREAIEKEMKKLNHKGIPSG